MTNEKEEVSLGELSQTMEQSEGTQEQTNNSEVEDGFNVPDTPNDGEEQTLSGEQPRTPGLDSLATGDNPDDNNSGNTNLSGSNQLDLEYTTEETPDYSEPTELTPGKKYKSHMLPNNWREMFLEHYRKTGNKTFSARMAGVKSVRTVYNEMERNPDFALAVEQSRMLAVEMLHNEAIRRAMGEPLRDEEGNVVARQQPSDKLLIFMLSSMSPEDYGHGAIQAEARRQNMRDDEDTKVRITLPENFRGQITIGKDDAFPDASILDAEFKDLENTTHKESDKEV